MGRHTSVVILQITQLTGRPYACLGGVDALMRFAAHCKRVFHALVLSNQKQGLSMALPSIIICIWCVPLDMSCISGIPDLHKDVRFFTPSAHPLPPSFVLRQSRWRHQAYLTTTVFMGRNSMQRILKVSVALL